MNVIEFIVQFADKTTNTDVNFDKIFETSDFQQLNVHSTTLIQHTSS